MNLFFKSYKIYLFFFLAALLKYAVLLGQDNPTSFNIVPEILEFEIPSKYNRSPNTSFCRDTNGVYFIGKEDGFLTIDAGRVFFYALNAPVYIARTDHNKIFYVTENDFGLLSYSISEGARMNSRKETLESHLPDYFPTGILAKDSTAFLATSEGVFVVTENSADEYFFNRQPIRMFNSGKQVFLQAMQMGLYRWDGNNFVRIADAELLRNKALSGIIEKDNHLLLLCSNSTPLWYNKESGEIDFAEHAGIFNQAFESLHFLYKDFYIGYTSTKELMIASGNNDLSDHVFRKSNEPGYELKTAFVDLFNDIWIVSDFNIMKMEFPSRSNFIDLHEQLGRYVRSAAFRHDTIYLTTTRGIFLLEPGEKDNWITVPLKARSDSYFHNIESFHNTIITTGISGTFQVIRDSLYKITDENLDFIKILNDHTFIGCNKNGISINTYQQGEWIPKIIDPNIHRINAHAECDQVTYILTEENDIFRVDNEQLIKVNLEVPAGDSLLRMFNYNGGLIFLGEKNNYSWDLESETCTPVPISELQKTLLSTDNIFRSSDHLWSISRDETGGSTLWMLDNELIQTPYFEILAKKSFGQVLDIDQVEDHLWITGNKMLLRLNIDSASSQKKKLLRIQTVSVIGDGQNNVTRQILPDETIRYRKQKIVIKLKNLRFQKAPYPYYRYKIDHYQKEWSEWNRSSNVIIEDPWENNYTIEAQSVSSFGDLSEPVTFSFSVSPPFYRTWAAYIFYLLVIFSLAFLLYKWRLLSLKRVEYKLEERIKERMKAVLSEKEKSDKLVADLFPKGTAEELKNRGRAKSKKFELVTVLFSDIQGFTRIAEEMNPEVLIDELDKFFFHFDSVVDKYNIEKIKTIGDAYMAAGGIPVKNSSNPVEVVLAGLEMQYYMNDLKKKKADIWDLRIGIHTGPVISGVVGHKKLSYDIWGDTVNTASRMESSGEGGKVNISGITHSLVKDFFLCEYRGKLPVKYKGNIDMYFVTGLRPELSVDLQGIPNRRFFIKLQLLKIKDLEERVLELIASNMTLNLHFYKTDYIQRVCNQTELLGRSENISDDDLLLLQTAALMMFSGLSETYDNFENSSIEITRQILPEYGYDEKQVDRICNLILATKEPFQPQNILESILVDARMEYIGRSDYLTQVKLLFLERQNVYRDQSREKFLKQQVSLISQFNYFTLAAQRLREITSEKQLENLRNWK